jgi:hypothetical protein
MNPTQNQFHSGRENWSEQHFISGTRVRDLFSSSELVFAPRTNLPHRKNLIGIYAEESSSMVNGVSLAPDTGIGFGRNSVNVFVTDVIRR